MTSLPVHLKCIVFILLAILASHATAALCPTPLRISLSSSWYPYLYADGNGDIHGEDWELLTNTLTAMRCDFEGQPVPERRLTREHKNGSVDISIGASHTKERAYSNYFSIPYRTEQVGIFHYHLRHSTNNLKTILDSGYIGVVNRSAWYGNDFEQLKATYPDSLLHIEGSERRIEMLLKNRADFVIGDKRALQSIAQRRGYPKLSQLTGLVMEEHVHFMFSKENISPEFLLAFNDALAVQLIEQK